MADLNRQAAATGVMKLELRPATAADADALTALARRAKAHWGYPADWLLAWEPQLTIGSDYIAQNRVLVAETDGTLVGMCALEDRGPTWYLEHVWVDPANVRCGIGRALVQQALEVARTVRPAPVFAEADPHAAGFYRRLGAREVGAVAAAMPGAPDRVLPIFELPPVAS